VNLNWGLHCCQVNWDAFLGLTILLSAKWKDILYFIEAFCILLSVSFELELVKLSIALSIISMVLHLKNIDFFYKHKFSIKFFFKDFV